MKNENGNKNGSDSTAEVKDEPFKPQKLGNIFTTRRMAVIAATAALYVLLTISLAPISYGEMQIRLSEIMNLLVFINPLFGIGMILGCFIANLFSPFALYDCIFGTLSTVFSVFMIMRSKKLFVASLWPTVSAVFIGFELLLVFGHHGTALSLAEAGAMSDIAINTISFFVYTGWVMVGQFAACTVIAYPIFRMILKNERLVKYLKKF